MRSLISAVLTAALLAPCVASAQSPPATPPATPATAPTAPAQTQRQDRDTLEPAVDTSAAPPSETSTTGALQAPASPKAEPPSGDGSAPSAAHEKASSGKAMDHLQLGTTDITGNRELPKVLYIVPWKRSDLGDVTGKPLNSLVDETLQPIDRDVFKRENRYYGAVAQKAAQGGTSGAASAADTHRNGSGAQRSSAGDER
jgi:hypothetical protein